MPNLTKIMMKSFVDYWNWSDWKIGSKWNNLITHILQAEKGGLWANTRQEASGVCGWPQHASQGEVWRPTSHRATQALGRPWLLVWQVSLVQILTCTPHCKGRCWFYLWCQCKWWCMSYEQCYCKWRYMSYAWYWCNWWCVSYEWC